MGTLTSSPARRARTDLCRDTYGPQRPKRFLGKLDGFLDLHVKLDGDDHTWRPILSTSRGEVRPEAREHMLFHQPVEGLGDIALRHTPNHSPHPLLCELEGTIVIPEPIAPQEPWAQGLFRPLS